MSTYSLTGPTTGPVNFASPQFTVTPGAAFTGVITPASSMAGTFNPTSLTFSASTTPQTFTFTPAGAGTANISTTNTGGFTDPAAIPYIAVAVPISYITTAGQSAIAGANPLGPLIAIGSFEIGSDNIFSDSAATLKGLTSVQSGGTNSAVYTMANTSQIQYNVLSPNEVAYIITLDETVGNFTIGNIGLYTTGGVLFAIVALSAVTSKVMNAGGILGNRRVYECIIDFSNAATLLNLTILTQFTYNLATVPTELLLPSPITPPYNVYLIQAHTKLGVPCLAINYNNAWTFFTSETTDAQSYGAIQVPPGSIASGINPGDAIYFNLTAKQYQLSSGNSATKFPTAVAGFGNYIYPNGSVFFNAAASYTVGDIYYCGNTAATGNVQLSGNANTPVGVAITANSLLILMKQANNGFNGAFNIYDNAGGLVFSVSTGTGAEGSANIITIEGSLVAGDNISATNIYASGTVNCQPAGTVSQAVTLAQFPSYLAANGYKKFPDSNSPSGYFVEQWGSQTVNAGGVGSFYVNVALFPIVFTGILWASANWGGTSPPTGTAAGFPQATNGMYITTNSAAGSGFLTYWQAKGY